MQRTFVLPLLAVFIVAIVTVTPLLCNAEFLTARQQEEQVCYSTIHGYVTMISVMTVPPSTGVDAIVFEGKHRKFEFKCIQAFDTGPVLAPSQATLCREGHTFAICTAPATTTDLTWTCTDYPEYVTRPSTDINIGGFNEDEKYFKIVWKSKNTATFCFPRDVTVMVTARPVTPIEPNVAATVIFILLVIGVGGVVLFFVSYQLRKVVNKFMKRDERASRSKNQEKQQNANLSPRAAQRTLKALGGITDNGAGNARIRSFVVADDMQHDAKSIERREREERERDAYEAELYGNADGIPTRGTQEAVLQDSGVVVASKPLQRNWYLRGRYDRRQVHLHQSIERDDTGGPWPYGATPSKRVAPEDIRGGTSTKRILDFSKSKSPRQGAARRGRPSPVNYANMYEADEDDDGYNDDRIVEIAPQHPRQDVDLSVYEAEEMASQQHQQQMDQGGSGAAEEGLVLTCLDCMLPIRDQKTPQFCGVTGKRHY